MKAKLAKRKTGFCMRMKESWKEMKLWDAEELNKLDWVISALILIFLFFTCAYGDLMLTGSRSFLMYEHFTDFYKASYEQSHGYYANYLPSTFLAYAIWNLPLYLTGHAPQAMLTNSFINNMWYKLLPVLLYYATSHLIYQIGVEAGFGEKKAKLCPQPDQICSGYGSSADDRSAAEYRKYLFQAQCSGIWRFEICAETIHHWLL